MPEEQRQALAGRIKAMDLDVLAVQLPRRIAAANARLIPVIPPIS